MVFASIPFLLLFLPAMLSVYFAIAAVCGGVSVERRMMLLNLWLFGASVVFYAWGEKRLFIVMVITVATDYLAGRIISRGQPQGTPLVRHTPRTPAQRAALVAALTINLALLAFFKYAGFGLTTAHRIAEALGASSPGSSWALDVTLPLGISFYTFQSMSYTIDVYRGEVAATRSFLDFACLVTMFPHLVAGPIIRYRDIGGQLRARVLSAPLFASGVTRFIVGLGKKTLIANTVAGPVDRIFAMPAPELTAPMAWLGTIGYAIQIYFDFSGYSDMAIGLGRMLGFQFRENFNYPYCAQGVTDFWRRWHISLSTWFRDYLYVPLGGNRGSEGKTYRNLLIVFFLCGLWHGAQWAFVCWGLYHGAFLIAERSGLSRILSSVPRSIRHAYTVLVVLGGWVLFRSPTLRYASRVWMAMVGLGAAGGIGPIGIYITPTVAVALGAGAIFSLPVVPWANERLSRIGETLPGRESVVDIGRELVEVAALAVVFIASFMWLAAGTYNPFIYYRF